jgi:diguanylate cyclase (GGDEF)-like protein/PAS domain S-box-containing protein
MADKDKSREELLQEVAELRQRLSEMEKAELKRLQYEKALTESEERYRSLVDSTDDSIYLVDRDYKYLFINKKHLSRLGLSEDEVKGKSYHDLHSKEETELFIDRASKAIKQGKSIQFEYASFRDARYFLQTYSPVKNSAGETVAVTVISKDITKRKHMEDELRTVSLTDELTGLYNRRGFLVLAEQHLKMANRDKKGIYMLYADLDGLKIINDKFGHREGDVMLNETAKILRESYRESDIIARIGGDEFVVIPIGIVGNDTAIIINRLQKKIDVYNSVNGHRGYKLEISAGLAYYDPQNPCSVDELLEKADSMMYEHKRRKKGL